MGGSDSNVVREARKSDLLQKKLTTEIEKNVNLQLEIEEAKGKESKLQVDIDALRSQNAKMEVECRMLKTNNYKLKAENQWLRKAAEEGIKAHAAADSVLSARIKAVTQNPDTNPSAHQKTPAPSLFPRLFPVKTDPHIQSQAAKNAPILSQQSSNTTKHPSTKPMATPVSNPFSMTTPIFSTFDSTSKSQAPGSSRPNTTTASSLFNSHLPAQNIFAAPNLDKRATNPYALNSSSLSIDQKYHVQEHGTLKGTEAQPRSTGAASGHGGFRKRAADTDLNEARAGLKKASVNSNFKKARVEDAVDDEDVNDLPKAASQEQGKFEVPECSQS
ncbi:hypothetical protein P7C71_g1637, partial [Lecanoromycetidae sp. Uapishka_2]